MLLLGLRLDPLQQLCRCNAAYQAQKVGGLGLTQPTGENEPPPDQRLPPRETGTELRRTTARPPPLHRQRHALEIEPGNATLKTLPTNADQEMPTPSGPTDLKMLSHTFFLREHFQGGGAAGSTGRVGQPKTPDSPKESFI